MIRTVLSLMDAASGILSARINARESVREAVVIMCATLGYVQTHAVRALIIAAIPVQELLAVPTPALDNDELMSV